MPSIVYLAFREGYASKATLWQKLGVKIIKARLVTKYPHGGVVLDGVLYHANVKNGVHAEPIPTGEVWRLAPTKINPEVFRGWYELVKGKPYDWFSLLAFIPFFKARWSKGMYCYEFQHYAVTGENPSNRVTPESLLANHLRVS
jgi:hypothetical protein